MLTGNNPYFISCSPADGFGTHRHPEIELSYCTEGEYCVVCEGTQVTLREGDFLIIPSMAAHEFSESAHCGRRITVMLGYLLLGEYFNAFSANLRVFPHKEHCTSAVYREFSALLRETAALARRSEPFGELTVKGNLYRLSALLLQLTDSTEEGEPPARKRAAVQRIDRALELIYTRYNEPLTVEAVGEQCGYSKSNFCKIFKTITGETFHGMLNRHRVEVACALLRDTDHSVETVARETGFADSKSFCRVFRAVVGTNAGEYRKNR